MAGVDVIFSPERLNVAVTRARTKLVVLISRRLLDAVPADQEQMDKAELLREFVFNAVPKGESLLRDPSGGQVRVQVRLLGFDGPPEFEEFGAGDSADAAPTAAMTRELEELFDAVQAAAPTPRFCQATTDPEEGR